MEGPNSICELTTYEPEPALDLPFDSESMLVFNSPLFSFRNELDTHRVMKMILKSSWLQEALSELHSTCEKITIIGNPPPPIGRGPALTAPPRLRLKATGTFGTTEVLQPVKTPFRTPLTYSHRWTTRTTKKSSSHVNAIRMYLSRTYLSLLSKLSLFLSRKMLLTDRALHDVDKTMSDTHPRSFLPFSDNRR